MHYCIYYYLYTFFEEMMERKNDDMTSKLIRLNKSIAIINVTLHLSDMYVYVNKSKYQPQKTNK